VSDERRDFANVYYVKSKDMAAAGFTLMAHLVTTDRPGVAFQVTHSPRLRIAVFAMALGCSTQSLKGCVGWQSQSQAGPSILSGIAVPVPGQSLNPLWDLSPSPEQPL